MKCDQNSKFISVKQPRRRGAKTFMKAFVCDVCDESFVRQDSLKSHIRLHKEFANSTLSTALAVLELQQPVLNINRPQVPVDPMTTVPSGECSDKPHDQNEMHQHTAGKSKYSGASFIRTSLIRTHVWEPIPIPQQKVPHLSGNSVIRTVSLGTEVSG